MREDGGELAYFHKLVEVSNNVLIKVTLYHVKDIAGAPYKIKKKRKTNKTTESPTVSSGGQTTVILCSTITIA